MEQQPLAQLQLLQRARPAQRALAQQPEQEPQGWAPPALVHSVQLAQQVLAQRAPGCLALALRQPMLRSQDTAPARA